jgi:hypothetical protein
VRPIPEHIHWDLWLGPAPERPFAGEAYHPSRWRGYWDFGAGALGDIINMPFMALNLRDPSSVQAESSGHNRDSYPKSSVVNFEFPTLDGRPAVKLIWHNGQRIDSALLDGAEAFRSGVLVVGDKGKLYAPGDYCENGIKLLGGATETKVEFPMAPPGGHFAEFIRACKGGEPAMSNFPDYGGPLTETILLGNLAVWAAPEAGAAGKKIEWDAKNLVATNAADVMSLVNAPRRPGYEL